MTSPSARSVSALRSEGWTVELPWPSAKLSPNSRQHWAQQARAKAAARTFGFVAVRSAGIGFLDADRLHVAVEFRPPDRRPRDLDNMLSSCKALFDGVADALGVDDSRWSLSLTRSAPVKGGAVIVTLTPEPTE